MYEYMYVVASVTVSILAHKIFQILTNVYVRVTYVGVTNRIPDPGYRRIMKAS